MSQQEKQPSQQQGVAQPVHAAASLPYQIAYISVPQTGAEGGGQAIRAVPFQIVPVLGQMPGLQMHHVAQLLQGQQMQAVYQDPKRQGAVVLAQGAGTGQAVLASLDPATRAALAPPPTANTAKKGHTMAGSQQTKSGATAAAAPTASDAAGGAAAAAPAGAGEAATSAAAEGTNHQPDAGTSGMAAGAAEGGESKAAADNKHTEAVSAQGQRGQQQQPPIEAGLPSIAVPSSSATADSPTSPAAAAMAAAAAAAASQIPAAAQAAIAAAEAAAAAAATATATATAIVGSAASPCLQQSEAAATGLPVPGQQQRHSSRGWDLLLMDSDGEGDVQAAEAGAASSGFHAAMATQAAAREPTAHELRVKQRRLFNLKRKYADLTAQIEGALCEVRALSSWKTTPRLAKLPRLEEGERRTLAAARARRLAEVTTKNCLAVIKAMMAHKFAFPFNSPVDLTKYPDYCSYVKTPMDFGTMKTKAEQGGYAEPAEVYNDAMLVFSNAKIYNQPAEDVFYMATVLQEFFQERWQKMVVPKLQEDAKTSRSEEDSLRARKAAVARQSAELAAQEAACRLVAHLDELHEQLGQLRVQAALGCEPLTAVARIGLAADLNTLPLKQLEAALGLVLPRLTSGLWEGQQQQQLRGQGGTEGKLQVEVDLARCNALELRQVQHFVAACQAASTSQQQQQQQSQQQQQQQQNTEPEAAATEAAATSALNKDAATAALDAPPVRAPFVDHAGELRAAVPTAAPSTPPGHSMSGFPISYVHDTTLSHRAGIIWPGQVVGAGLKACPRLMLPGQSDQPPAAAGMGLIMSGLGQGSMLKHGAFNAGFGKRKSSETGTARPPLPPAARPSRLATGTAALQFTPSVAAAAGGGGGGPVTPSSPFAGPAATMVAPGAADSTPPVTQPAMRRQLTVASSSTDLQQQGQQAVQQQDEVKQDDHHDLQDGHQHQHQHHRQLVSGSGQDDDVSSPKTSSGAEPMTTAGVGGAAGDTSRSGSRSGSPTDSQQHNGSDSRTDQRGSDDDHHQVGHTDLGQPEEQEHGYRNCSPTGIAAGSPETAVDAQQAAVAAATAKAGGMAGGDGEDDQTSQDEEFVDASEAATVDSSEGHDKAAGDDMEE